MENKKKWKKSILYYIVIAICLLLSGGLGVNSLDSDSGKENNTTIEVQEDINNIEEQEKQEEIVDNKEQVDVSYENSQEDNEYTEKQDVEDVNSNSQQSNPVLEEENNEKEDTKENKQEEERIETEEVVSIEYTFRNEGTFQSHYEKHGIEMGFETKEDYLLAANKVILNPESLHKLEKEDGDDVYYLEESNEFVVVSKDGYIRTYFLPSAGINYYNRQ